MFVSPKPFTQRVFSESYGPPANPVPGDSVLHSAWQPYRLLAPTTRRRLDAKNDLPAESFLDALSIPPQVASERLQGKYLQLEPPRGKMTEQRKLELEKKAERKEIKRVKRVKEGECGLIGRRRRARMGKEVEGSVRYEAVAPLHTLWLGYMSELLSIPLAISSPYIPSLASTSTSIPPVQSTSTLTSSTATLVPTFPPRNGDTGFSSSADLNINVGNVHTKLVKAEFVGCLLSVKRAKNPSLVKLEGIVLQETQGTFKIVTFNSKIKVLPKKGSIFTFSLPLPPTVSTTADPIDPSLTITATSTTRELSFDLYGDSFCYKSAERVGRKWKAGAGSGGVELM